MKKFLPVFVLIFASTAFAVVNFPDVSEDDWFYPGVVYVSDNGIMTGYENGDFGPNDVVNRAQLATILHRINAAEVVKAYNELNTLRLYDVEALKGSSWEKYKEARFRFPVEGIQGDGEGTIKYENVAGNLQIVATEGSYYNNFEILALSRNAFGPFFIKENSEFFETAVFGPFYDDVDRIADEV